MHAVKEVSSDVSKKVAQLSQHVPLSPFGILDPAV